MEMRDMLERARAMQAKAAELQRTMAAIEVEGLAGGGLVRVTLTGNGVLKAAHVDPSLLKPEESEVLQDLIVAAHADAKRAVEARLAKEMGQLAGQLGLPAGFG